MKVIDISNFYSQVNKYCSEKSLDVCDDEIIIKMIKDGYSFSNIPPSRIKRGLAELRIMYSNHEESKSIIMDGLKPCPHCEKIEEIECKEYNLDSEPE